MTSDVFLSRAAQRLPVEKAYDYHRTLREGPVHRPRRDPAALPTAEEMSIPMDGWKVLIHAKAGPLARDAANDLREYLATSMRVRIAVERRESLDEWAAMRNVIVAGVREQLPGGDVSLKRSKDYEIRVAPDRIVVRGYDDLGMMHGLFNLEARMNLREGPFLPRDLKTVRHSLYRTRMVLSWLGWMQWPDPYLSHLAHDGYDAIFASTRRRRSGRERSRKC